MKLGKLEPWEHMRTRALYEEIFTEDDQRFVDYYYKWKTKDNIIYAAEDEGTIHAMIHLNPFRVSVCGRIEKLHYIVAVATREQYRHQGLMRRLLSMAEQDMAAAGEKLTFLMPASEKIYLPFGYRFFGWQRRGVLEPGGQQIGNHRDMSGTDEKLSGIRNIICRPLRAGEYGALAEFVNRELEKQFDIYIYRDAAYYERLCAEQECQGGNVMVICRDSDDFGIIGVFCTACEPEEESPSLREIILSREYFVEAQAALANYAGRYGRCRAEGCQKELKLEEESWVPLLMGKIPGEGIFSDIPPCGSVFINEVV